MGQVCYPDRRISWVHSYCVPMIKGAAMPGISQLGEVVNPVKMTLLLIERLFVRNKHGIIYIV
jgi:hypothetical protein